MKLDFVHFINMTKMNKTIFKDTYIDLFCFRFFFYFIRKFEHFPSFGTELFI